MRKQNFFVVVLAFVTIFLAESFNLCFAQSSDISALGSEISQHKKYTMYLGTKDKDTMRQEIPTEKIREQMHEICMKYADGYTLAVMDGYYRDSSGKAVHEVSLVYIFLDTPINSLKNIMDEALVKFNQSSILLEETEGRSTFYQL